MFGRLDLNHYIYTIVSIRVITQEKFQRFKNLFTLGAVEGTVLVPLQHIAYF